MISLLEGIIHSRTPQSITLVCNGIGFEIAVAHPQEYKEHEKAVLTTYMHWNQEHGFSLFGFRSQEEKKLFILLIECQGVGPKLAMTALASLGVATLVDAFIHKKKEVLSSVSGIGQKKAELIIISLNEKVSDLVQQGAFTLSSDSGQFHDIAQALQALNYNKHEVSKVLDTLRQSNVSLSFDQLLRKALQLISTHTTL